MFFDAATRRKVVGNAVAPVERPGSAAAAATEAVSGRLETPYPAQHAAAAAELPQLPREPLVEGLWQARAVLRLSAGCAAKPVAELLRNAQWAVCTPINEWRAAVTTARVGQERETATDCYDGPTATAGRPGHREQSKSWWWHGGGGWVEAWQALAELDAHFGAILADALLFVFCDVAAASAHSGSVAHKPPVDRRPIASFPPPRLVPLGCAALGALLACGAISSVQVTTALAEAEAADNPASTVHACALLRREVQLAWTTAPALHVNMH